MPYDLVNCHVHLIKCNNLIDAACHSRQPIVYLLDLLFAWRLGGGATERQKRA